MAEERGGEQTAWRHESERMHARGGGREHEKHGMRPGQNWLAYTQATSMRSARDCQARGTLCVESRVRSRARRRGVRRGLVSGARVSAALLSFVNPPAQP